MSEHHHIRSNDVARVDSVLKPRPKWGFKYLVVTRFGSETFNDKYCAYQYARATHGTLWPIEAVIDYSRNMVSIKDGHEPIKVD